MAIRTGNCGSKCQAEPTLPPDRHAVHCCRTRQLAPSRNGRSAAAAGNPASRTNSRFDGLPPVIARQISQASLEPPYGSE